MISVSIIAEDASGRKACLTLLNVSGSWAALDVRDEAAAGAFRATRVHEVQITTPHGELRSIVEQVAAYIGIGVRR